MVAGSRKISGNGSVTAPASAPTGYVIFYGTGSDFPAPADGTTYATGSSYTFGGSSFIAVNTATAGNFTLSGLNSSSSYHVYVFSYNAESCSTTPLYSSAVFGTLQTTTGPTDYFRSQTTGNWATPATWQSSYDNINWATATTAPNGSAKLILVQNSDNVTVAASTTAANLAISTAATLTVNSGSSLTLGHGTGTDMDVSGTVENAGDITPATAATIIFESGSRYDHTRDGGTIPAASWDNSSTCELSGIKSGVPAGLGQGFGNFIWSSNITTDLSLNSSLATVNGDLTYSPSSSANNLSLASGSPLTLNIGGNLLLQGSSGAFRLSDGGASPVLNITKSLTMSAGLLDMGSGPASGSINVNGNVAISGAAGITSSAGINGSISFSGTAQSLSSATSGAIGTVNFNVNSGSTTTLQTSAALSSASSFNVLSGGTLVAPGENTITDDGSSAYNQNAGGTLQIGSSAGITLAGASGNVRTSSRAFSAGGNYVYNGLIAQSTGTGLPVS